MTLPDDGSTDFLDSDLMREDDEPPDIDGGELSFDPYAGQALFYEDDDYDLGLGEIDGGGC